MQNILVVMEKNSFFVTTMIEQLKELNYNVLSTELDVQQLSKEKENFEAILLYMESNAKEKSQELCYAVQQR